MFSKLASRSSEKQKKIERISFISMNVNLQFQCRSQNKSKSFFYNDNYLPRGCSTRAIEEFTGNHNHWAKRPSWIGRLLTYLVAMVNTNQQRPEDLAEDKQSYFFGFKTCNLLAGQTKFCFTYNLLILYYTKQNVKKINTYYWWIMMENHWEWCNEFCCIFQQPPINNPLKIKYRKSIKQKIKCY